MKTQRRRLRLLAGAALAVSTAGMVILPAGAAHADNAGDQPFSGWVRNYSAYAGAQILNGLINARVNIGESIAVADSTGLNKPGYGGTSTGDLAVPGSVTSDPTSRTYGRSAPIGVGAIGLNLQPLNTESISTTTVDGAQETLSTPLAHLDISPLGKLSLISGLSDSNWNAGVLENGGRLAYSDSSIGVLELLNTGIPGLNLPLPIPGFSSLFPLAQAELGQNTSEVKLVSDTAACPTGLAVQSRATWDFADVHLFNGFIDIAWGGNAGNGVPDSAVMTATVNGLPGGARVVSPELGDMTVRVGDLDLEIQPGAALELGQILDDANGLGNVLKGFVDGEIAYGGVTDLHESADGTWAHAALNGLEANLSLLPLPIIAPSGLGSIELGVMRGEVDAKAPAGGLNCEVDPGTSTPGTSTPGTATPGTATPGTATPGTATPGTATPGTATPGTATPGTTTPGETTPGTATPGTATPGTTTPGETTPGTATPGTATPGTTTPGETTPGTATPGTATPGTTTPGETTPGTATPGTATPGTTTPGEATPGTTVTGTTTPGTTITGTTSVGVTTPGTSTPGTSTPGTATPGTTTPGETTPGTATPGTATPGTATPGTATPGTATPGTTTPGETTPGTTVTGTATPGTTITGTTSVGVTTPGTSTPGTATPGTATPGTATPGTATPGTATPGTATPGTATPGTATPGTATPGTATPGTATPGTATPGTATPGTATPGTATPGTATPGTATPGTATPGTATPGTATPGTATPGTTTPGTTSNGTVSPPVGTATNGTTAQGTSGVDGLPNTGGVPVQLLALALGLVLLGGRLLGASRYWQKTAGR